jgi:tetratricopeptide (TPR) repeat protein
VRSDGGRWRHVGLAGAILIIACLNGQAQSAPGGQTGKAGEAGISSEFRRFRLYPHLDRAYKLISRDQLPEAKLELMACLELDGKDAAIWSAYFDVLYRLKEYDGLVARFDDLGELRRDARLRKYYLLAQLERQDLEDVLDNLRATGGQNDRLASIELQRIAGRFTDLARAEKKPELLIAFLATAPDSALSPPILYEAANALRSMGSVSDADAAYQRVVKAADAGKLRVEAYKALASLSFEQGRQTQGHEFLTRAHDLQPRDPSVVRSLADAAAAREDWSGAVRWYRESMNLSQGASRDDRYRDALGLGRAYVRLSQPDRAGEAFAQALEVRPNDVEALVAAAQVHQEQGGLVEALGELRTALNVAPSGNLNAQVGLLTAQLGRPSEALPYLERARALGVSEALAPALFGQLGYTYAALNQPRAAVTAFEKALPQSPNRAAIHAALGYASFSLDNFPSAISHFEESLSLHDDPHVWRGLTLAYSRAGKGDLAARAIAHLQQAPNGEAMLDIEVWNQVAEAEFRNGRFREAATLFRQSSAHSNGQGWSALARAGESLERAVAFSEAAAIWEEVAASSLAPAGVRGGAAERAGYTRLRLGEQDRAASSFQLAIRLGHDSWQIRLDRALTLSKLARWPEALDESLASLQQHDGARGNIAAAQCFKMLDKPGMAIYHFSRSLDAAADLDPKEQKYVLDELTSLYANEASYEESSKVAARSLRISADPAVALGLARAQRRLGRKKDARATLDAIDTVSLSKALKLAVLDEQAGLSVELGDKPRAVKTLQEAARVEPTDSRLFQLGTYLRDVGDLDKAVASLRASVDAAPGNNLQYREALGYTYLRAGQLRNAADMLAGVAKQEPDNVQIQQDVADVLRRLGDIPGALRQLHQAIDRAASAAISTSPEDGNRRQETVLQMQSSVGQLTKTYEGAAYFGYQSLAAPNSAIDRKAPSLLLLSQGGFELARYLTGPQSGLSLIGRVMTLGSGIGTVANPGQSQLDLQPQATLSQLAIGFRYKPFVTENLNFSAERLVQLHGDLPDSWIARALYGKETGGDPRPDERWHPYALVYGDLAGFIGRYESLLAYGETRLGASWAMSNTWSVRPHVVAVARRDFVGSAGDALQVGAGLSITRYFRENGYVGPAPSLELRVYGSAARAGPLGPNVLDGLLNGAKALTAVSTLRF